jgi:hypothetical protein
VVCEPPPEVALASSRMAGRLGVATFHPRPYLGWLRATLDKAEGGAWATPKVADTTLGWVTHASPISGVARKPLQIRPGVASNHPYAPGMAVSHLEVADDISVSHPPPSKGQPPHCFFIFFFK